MNNNNFMILLTRISVYRRQHFVNTILRHGKIDRYRSGKLDRANSGKLKYSIIKSGKKPTNQQRNITYNLILLFIVCIIVGLTLNRIELHMIVKQVKTEGIDYDSFRNMKISEDIIKRIVNKLDKDKDNSNSINPTVWEDNLEVLQQGLNRKYDIIDVLTISMMVHDFDLGENSLLNNRQIKYLYNRLYYNNSFIELKKYYYSVFNDIECFPVPFKDNKQSFVTFNDTWNALRTYGGNRRHEGTDLMPEKNISGYYKIISMTEGVVEKLGWLEQGGYRIGIRGNTGAYYYYAHLSSYAPEIKIGDTVSAGQLLGYMGDSGYGVEGTTGMFDVHLHFGIYLDTNFGEMSINPYAILLYLEQVGDKESYN